MNCSSKLACVVVLLLGFSALVRADAPLSAEEYRKQLHVFAGQVRSLKDHPEQAGAVIATIPDEVTVRADGGELKVSYHHLKNALAEYSRAGDRLKGSQLDALNAYLDNLEADAADAEHSPAEAANARQRLNVILSRREFRNVHGPGLKETLLSRLYRWLWRLLGRLHFGSGGAFTVLQVLVYVLVATALVLMLLWTIRRLRRNEEDLPPREIIPFSPSAKSWRAWLVEAHDFAESGDWRNAIHLAYWAGISFLESGGAWKPNRARTPREYLRLLNSRSPNYAPLTALTKKFELIWYGDRQARQEDFQDTLGQLEKLGCR